MAPKDTVVLNTGAEMPLFGLGTFLANKPEELVVALKTALDNGYRLIDTAAFYRNEGVIGGVLHEYLSSGKLKREEIFVTTKLPSYAMEPEEAAKCIEKQLNELQLDYVDLYLVHTPFCSKPKDPNNVKLVPESFNFKEVPHIDTWRVLEKYYKAGKLKAIGLSNFNAQQIQDLHGKAEIKPANLQVECTLYWPQEELLALCKKLNMTFTSYSTLGNPGRAAGGFACPPDIPLDEPLVHELAKKYGKTPAQILLRHQLQRGIAVIPKSTNPGRVIENSQLDFTISIEDFNKLNNDVKKRIRCVEFRHSYGHPQYPFLDIIEKDKAAGKH